MTSSRSVRNLLVTPIAAFVLAAMAATPASAQQISYYNFNTPATASPLQYSYNCSTAETSSTLFCFNFPVGATAVGTTRNPNFIQDPASTGPYAVQMTYPQPSQSGSMWFAVPQNIANGFNVWFAFKITPNSNAYATADGLALVIQNALNGGTDSTTGCSASGQGSTALGSGGGCMGYGGIPNSVALEFDTYNNAPWDPDDYGNGGNYDNHIALQSCGLSEGYPLPNSPAHLGSGNCLVSLGGPNNTSVSTLIENPKTSAASPATGSPVTLADGNVHQVVLVYNGPLDSPANTLSVYLDPQYNPGTLTPVSGSTPLFTGSFDITQYINLASDSASAPAYIGFTSATGSAFEQHEVMGWTFTPHTTVTQQQPLNPAGTPTTFNFGTHSYTVNFPPSTSTDNITMGVIANTITPAQFSTLLGFGPTQFTGSQCQVYDDTGGKCVIYSVYCSITGTNAPAACPAPETPPTDCSTPGAADCIDLTSSYNNSIQPTSPGYLQGDPLYSPVSSIYGDGATATVTCMGECAVHQGQTITVLDASNTPAFPGVTVQSVLAPNEFTFSSTAAINQSGGFLTSNNVQNIFISYTPQNIDGSTTGQSKNFSDFVVTGVTTKLPVATVAPAKIDFGTLYLGSIVTKLVTITNSGLAPMSIADPFIALVRGGNSSEFITLNLCPKTLAIGKSCYMTVTFVAGPFYNPQTATLTISDNAPGSPQSIPLTATVINPRVRLSTSSLNFGSHKVGTGTTTGLTITNTGTTDLSIGSIGLEGTDPLDFSAPNTCPVTLSAGSSCTLQITFTPQAKKGRSAVLVIPDNAQNSPQTVSLAGTGNN